jgi:hypothetical protein
MCSWKLPYEYRSLFQALRVKHALNLSACNRDGLSSDRARCFAAQPNYGIGDFRRRHKAALRIMPG